MVVSAARRVGAVPLLGVGALRPAARPGRDLVPGGDLWPRLVVIAREVVAAAYLVAWSWPGAPVATSPGLAPGACCSRYCCFPDLGQRVGQRFRQAWAGAGLPSCAARRPPSRVCAVPWFGFGGVDLVPPLAVRQGPESSCSGVLRASLDIRDVACQ